MMYENDLRKRLRLVKQAMSFSSYSDSYIESMMWAKRDCNTSIIDIRNAVIIAKKMR